MKKLNNDATRGKISLVIAIAITSIFAFCTTACLYKLCFHQEWAGPSIVVLICTIIGGVFISYYVMRVETSEKTEQEMDKAVKNLLIIGFVISIVLAVIILFITAVVLNMNVNSYIYPIIAFVSLWVGIIGTLFIAYWLIEC